MTKNSLSCLISQEPFLIWSSFVVQKCKMIISPGFFFISSKFWFFRLLGGSKGKNGPKWQKNSNSVSQELYLLWLWLLVQMCKRTISPGIFYFFSFFQNSDFSGFSKFINKCQKEILRCAPPSSHVCDFLPKVRYT